MSISRTGRIVGTLALAGGAWGVLSTDRPPPPVASPVFTDVDLLLQGVYTVERELVRVPAEWAEPLVVRAGLTTWIATLPLDPAVRDRILARVNAKGSVDELVPFALFVKDMYDRTGQLPSFDDHARATIRPRADVPGFEHALFRFAVPDAPSSPTPGMPPGLASRLLALYDAAWLRESPAGGPPASAGGPPASAGAPPAPADGPLQCSLGDVRRTDARARAAAPEIRALLTDLRASLDAPGDTGAALDAVLADPDTLHTVTFTLLEFVDAEVCKHYRLFAREVVRPRALAAWGAAQLRSDDPSALWGWLQWSESRPRAVHVVVDGLQGQLVESLATGRAGDAFLTAAVAEQEAISATRPKLRSARPAPTMATGFLRHMAAEGYAAPEYLPFFRSLYAGKPPGVVAQGISTTPTISVRNLPIAKTGAPVAGPGGTGIPNFHFVDRAWAPEGGEAQGRGWYFYGNDALRLTELTETAGMKTMFARASTLETMSCGAQYDEAAGYSFDAFLSLALGEKLRDFGERLCVAELQERAATEVRLQELRRALLERRPLVAASHHPWELYDRWLARAETDRAVALWTELATLHGAGLPDYLLVYNPWPDHFAHGLGPYSDAIIGPTGELNRLDHWLGRVHDAYRDGGVLDDTLFGMAGDHGLAPVWWLVSPEEEVFAALQREGRPLRIQKISSDEGEGPKLTDPLRPPTMKGFDAIVASTAGGNYMLDLFVDQGAGFTRQPVATELAALPTLSGDVVDWPRELVTRLGATLDYLVVREAPCSPDGGVVSVRAIRDGVDARGRIERRGDRVRYTWEGADLLDVSTPSPWDPPSPEAWAARAEPLARCLAATDDAATWCTQAEWRSILAPTARPDSVNQLAHLYDTDRAGTINLFPRPGIAYNSQVPGRHAGEHFAEKDAFAGIWGAPLPPGDRVAVAQIGAVPMALYAWLSSAPPEATGGWGYETVLVDKVR